MGAGKTRLMAGVTVSCRCNQTSGGWWEARAESGAVSTPALTSTFDEATCHLHPFHLRWMSASPYRLSARHIWFIFFLNVIMRGWLEWQGDWTEWAALWFALQALGSMQEMKRCIKTHDCARARTHTHHEQEEWKRGNNWSTFLVTTSGKSPWERINHNLLAVWFKECVHLSKLSLIWTGTRSRRPTNYCLWASALWLILPDSHWNYRLASYPACNYAVLTSAKP